MKHNLFNELLGQDTSLPRWNFYLIASNVALPVIHSKVLNHLWQGALAAKNMRAIAIQFGPGNPRRAVKRRGRKAVSYCYTKSRLYGRAQLFGV
jgi:hypothetical protein